MESNKYNIENFERFLREKTDDFRMYPSKRVWYSIYNNMHPGNRLPSVSMTIVLIGFLFLIGHLNTSDSAKQNSSKAISQTAQQSASFSGLLSAEKKSADYNTTIQNDNTFAPAVSFVNSSAVGGNIYNNKTENSIAGNQIKRRTNSNVINVSSGNAVITVATSAGENTPGIENAADITVSTVAVAEENTNTISLTGVQAPLKTNELTAIVSLNAAEAAVNNEMTTEKINTVDIKILPSAEQATASVTEEAKQTEPADLNNSTGGTGCFNQQQPGNG
jgi:hypothetical protein